MDVSSRHKPKCKMAFSQPSYGLSSRALFSMRERIIYGSVLSRVTLGRLFSLSLATRFSSLSSEGGCRGNEMMAVWEASPGPGMWEDFTKYQLLLLVSIPILPNLQFSEIRKGGIRSVPVTTVDAQNSDITSGSKHFEQGMLP